MVNGVRLAALVVFPLFCYSQEFVRLPGTVHPNALPVNDIGPADPAQRIGYVSVMLKRTAAQQAALDALLQEQQNPASPNFHQWLTPEQFGERFGASSADIARLTTWLKSQGLTIENVARGRDWIACSGTVARFQTAFHTTIRRYHVDNEDHFANSTPISVPSEFAGLIQLVRGLNDFYPKPNGAPRAVHADFTNSSGFHYLAPDDWATIYDVAKLYNMGFNAKGQRIVVIGTSDIVTTDISQFQTLFGLPISPIEQHLGGVDPGISNATQGEANLDLEWSGAIARGATIVYDYAKNLYDAVQDAIDNDRAPVMTMSFGGCDAGDQEIAYYRSIYALKANSMGMTWLASSGDSGPANCDSHSATTAVNGLSANFPASIPEVTGVGGTEFNEAPATAYWSNTNSATLSSALGYIPEMVWNESGSTGLWSSGGGPSALFAKPLWQTGPGVPNDGARDTPDLALTAADHDGYRVVLNGDSTWIFSGTSASTPSFAGVVAILNQYLAAKGLGNINPSLYGMWSTTPTAFHDITVGNNIVACTVGTPNCTTGTFGYTAGPGYDLVTGIGSVDVYNLVTNWKAVTPPVLPSLVTATVTPNPVYQTPPDSNGFTFDFNVILTESNGGQTTLNTFSIGSASYTTDIVPFFGTNIIPPKGSIAANIGYKSLTVPVTFPFAFTGTDPGGKTWTQTVSVQFLPAAAPTMQITAVANGASFLRSFTSGMEVSVFGTLLSSSTAIAGTLPLPSTLGGATATVNGVSAPFYYASPGQLNIQIPYGIPNGSATLSVTANGQTATFPFTISSAAPGIYVGTNSALVPASTATRGSIVSLYMTGTGAQIPAIATGAAPPSTTPLNQLPQPVAAYSITVGGIKAPITFFGIPPFLVGVTQANFQVPANLALGTQPVIVTVGGVASAAANLTITQ
jgi:uncharacterized protein (TIGR03437 family)